MSIILFLISSTFNISYLSHTSHALLLRPPQTKLNEYDLGRKNNKQQLMDDTDWQLGENTICRSVKACESSHVRFVSVAITLVLLTLFLSLSHTHLQTVITGGETNSDSEIFL